MYVGSRSEQIEQLILICLMRQASQELLGDLQPSKRVRRAA